MVLCDYCSHRINTLRLAPRFLVLFFFSFFISLLFFSRKKHTLHHFKQMSEPKWKRALKSRLLLKPPVDEDPRLFSSRTKGIILVCLGLCAATPGFSSTIYFPGKFI